MCTFSHEYATITGISDGNMRAIGLSREASIYPIRGIHEIGYKNLDIGQTLYFDLTSRAYVFSVNHKAGEAVSHGVMFIEESGTQALEKVYSTKWRRADFQPDQSASDYVRHAMHRWIKPE